MCKIKDELLTIENPPVETKELFEEKYDCDKCNDTGVVEVMGGTDYDEWTVIDEKICECQSD